MSFQCKILHLQKILKIYLIIYLHDSIKWVGCHQDIGLMGLLNELLLCIFVKSISFKDVDYFSLLRNLMKMILGQMLGEYKQDILSYLMDNKYNYYIFYI